MFLLPEANNARPVTVRLGVATVSDDGTNFAWTLKIADSLLYQAQKGGKDRVVDATSRAEASENGNSI